jgi:hypothetical protein
MFAKYSAAEETDHCGAGILPAACIQAGSLNHKTHIQRLLRRGTKARNIFPVRHKIVFGEYP